ncbi:MAG: hypothetical protein JW797_12620 [Bradymonadales bacterium]|nr:hypothetical protein [Bradymonadales bacterium]
MDRVYLTNFYYYQHILEYSPATGEYQELTRDRLPFPDADKGPGVYIEKAGEVYGLRPSAGGPVFLRGQEQIPLKAGVHTGRFLCDGEERTFVLQEGDGELFQVSYTANVLEEFDMYSGGPEDFFDWLTKKLQDDFLFELYTVG